jgi:hypothetical protein
MVFTRLQQSTANPEGDSFAFERGMARRLYGMIDTDQRLPIALVHSQRCLGAEQDRSGLS